MTNAEWIRSMSDEGSWLHGCIIYVHLYHQIMKNRIYQCLTARGMRLKFMIHMEI